MSLNKSFAFKPLGIEVTTWIKALSTTKNAWKIGSADLVSSKDTGYYSTFLRKGTGPQWAEASLGCDARKQVGAGQDVLRGATVPPGLGEIMESNLCNTSLGRKVQESELYSMTESIL